MELGLAAYPKGLGLDLVGTRNPAGHGHWSWEKSREELVACWY